MARKQKALQRKWEHGDTDPAVIKEVEKRETPKRRIVGYLMDMKSDAEKTAKNVFSAQERIDKLEEATIAILQRLHYQSKVKTGGTSVKRGKEGEKNPSVAGKKYKNLEVRVSLLEDKLTEANRRLSVSDMEKESLVALISTLQKDVNIVKQACAEIIKHEVNWNQCSSSQMLDVKKTNKPTGNLGPYENIPLLTRKKFTKKSIRARKPFLSKV